MIVYRPKSKFLVHTSRSILRGKRSYHGMDTLQGNVGRRTEIAVGAATRKLVPVHVPRFLRETLERMFSVRMR